MSPVKLWAPGKLANAHGGSAPSLVSDLALDRSVIPVNSWIKSPAKEELNKSRYKKDNKMFVQPFVLEREKIFKQTWKCQIWYWRRNCFWQTLWTWKFSRLFGGSFTHAFSAAVKVVLQWAQIKNKIYAFNFYELTHHPSRLQDIQLGNSQFLKWTISVWTRRRKKA